MRCWITYNISLIRQAALWTIIRGAQCGCAMRAEGILSFNGAFGECLAERKCIIWTAPADCSLKCIEYIASKVCWRICVRIRRAIVLAGAFNRIVMWQCCLPFLSMFAFENLYGLCTIGYQG